MACCHKRTIHASHDATEQSVDCAWAECWLSLALKGRTLMDIDANHITNLMADAAFVHGSLH